MNRPLTTLFSSKHWGLTAAWFTALLGVIAIAISLDNGTSQFLGTAGSDEQLISFQHPVEIVQVTVVEGQSVEQESHLLEVRRSDLASRQAIIEDQIREIQIRDEETLTAIAAELENLKAQRQTSVAELDNQINSMESQYALNLKIMKDISGAKALAQNSELSAATVLDQDNTSPIVTEITGLKESKQLVLNSFQTQIENLQRQLNNPVRQANAQIAELEERRAELMRQKKELYVKAEFAGNVGSIMHNPGEQVAAFSPILSVHSSSPSFIKGYIHETIINEVNPGQAVWIKSLSITNSSIHFKGTIESIGNRIVEFPPRLRSNPAVTAWGREVVVFIDLDTSLLLGEKVMVLTEKPQSLGDLARNMLSKIIPKVYADN